MASHVKSSSGAQQSLFRVIMGSWKENAASLGCKIRPKLRLCFAFRLLPQIRWFQTVVPRRGLCVSGHVVQAVGSACGLTCTAVGDCHALWLIRSGRSEVVEFLEVSTPISKIRFNNPGNHGLNLFSYLLFHYVASTTAVRKSCHWPFSAGLLC